MKAIRYFLLIFAMALPEAAYAAGTCVTKPVKNAKGVDFALMLIVTDADATDLLSLGFASTPCGALSRRVAEYRALICKVSTFGNEAVQSRFTDILGLSAARLCASANAIVG